MNNIAPNELTTEPHECIVVGAGPAGLATLKTLRDAGINALALEREDDVGGNWYFGRSSSSVYQSTHLISSKRFTEFPGFPMPDDFPAYPSHRQFLQYVRSYADRFRLRDQIRFQSALRQAIPVEDGWRLEFDDGRSPLVCRNLVIATGNYWCPRLPKLEGQFSGRILHSREYKSPDQVRDKSVVVIGNGNTGCDIAVEAGHAARKVVLSIREGRYLMPKFLFGLPADQVGDWTFKWRLPRWLRAAMSWFPMHIAVGPLEHAGLPRPKHKLFERQPVMNPLLPQAIGHGRVSVAPPVERLDGDEVVFSDGSRAAADLVICATGYQLRLPFLAPDAVPWDGDHPRLSLNIFPPDRGNLFFTGMIEPRTRFPELVALQAQLVAAAIHSQSDPSRRITLQRMMDAELPQPTLNQEEFLGCEYYSYKKRLEQMTARLK
jgi:hypothetical protein